MNLKVAAALAHFLYSRVALGEGRGEEEGEGEGGGGEGERGKGRGGAFFGSNGASKGATALIEGSAGLFWLGFGVSLEMQ